MIHVHDEKDEFDDDMDFDDLDDIENDDDDSLDEGAWDDFDDDMSDDDLGDTTAPSKKKGFVAKNFNLIIIAVVLLGGGGWVYTQILAPGKTTANLSSDTASNAVDPVPTSSDLANDDALPPMPAPINPAETEVAQTPSENNTPSASDILTPMPEPEENNTIDLAPITNTTQEEASLSELKQDTSDMAANLSADIESMLSTEDESIDEPSVTVSEAEAVAIEPMPDMEAVPTQEVTTSELTSPAPSNLSAETSPPEAEKNMALDNENQNISAQMPAPVIEEKAPETILPTEDFSKEVDELETKLEKSANQNDALQGKLDAANTKISDLESAISKLENKLQEMAQEQEKTEQDAQLAIEKAKEAENRAQEQKTQKSKPTPESLEKPKIKPEQEITSKDAEETEKQKTAETSTQWKLRSAQPGKAVLANENTQNVRPVSVGDTISGLGKITSIMVENNLWVVRGTEGTVSQ